MEWGILIDIFLFSVDKRSGSLRVDPFETLEYPVKTFEVFVILQANFLDFLPKDERGK